LQKSSVQKDVNASVTTETAFATCVGFGFTLLHFLWKPVKERFGFGDSLSMYPHLMDHLVNLVIQSTAIV